MEHRIWIAWTVRVIFNVVIVTLLSFWIQILKKKKKTVFNHDVIRLNPSVTSSTISNNNKDWFCKLFAFVFRYYWLFQTRLINPLMHEHSCKIPSIVSIVMAKPLAISKLRKPRYDKTNKMSVPPAKTQISLGIRPVWSVFTVRMKKAGVLSYPFSAQWTLIRLGGCLIWVFAGRTLILLVLSCRGSYYCNCEA